MSLFEEMAAAGEAMRRVPQLEAELARVRGELEVERQKHAQYEERFAQFAAEAAEVKAKLEAAEAALAQATKSEALAKERFEKVLDVLKDLRDYASETVNEVNPPPPPVEPALPDYPAPEVAAPSTFHSGDMATDGNPTEPVSGSNTNFTLERMDTTPYYQEPQTPHDNEGNPPPNVTVQSDYNEPTQEDVKADHNRDYSGWD